MHVAARRLFRQQHDPVGGNAERRRFAHTGAQAYLVAAERDLPAVSAAAQGESALVFM